MKGNNILLITSEPSSANFSILLISIKASYPNSKIYYIFKARGEEEYYRYKDFRQNDIYYFPCRNNFEESFLRKYRKDNANVFQKIVDYLYCKISSCSNIVLNSKFETQLIDVARYLINKHRIDIVFTSNNPYHAHKTALSISTIMPITWYQFWLDPFFSSPSFNRFRINDICKVYLERKLFNAASKILVLPEVPKYDPVMLDYKLKVKEIEIPYITNKDISHSNHEVVFAGSLVKGLREPEPVFTILSESIKLLDKQIKFVFYVKNRNIYDDIERINNGRIVFNNYILRDDLDRIQSHAMALMNIGNINTCQMPSKVVEYIAYRKPILFFYTDCNDPSFRYFSKYPNTCFINVNDDLCENAKLLARFLNTEHPCISYDSLLEIELFRKSTPEYIASLIHN